MGTKLPLSVWGHAILHAVALVRIRPTIYHEVSPLQLVFGGENKQVKKGIDWNVLSLSHLDPRTNQYEREVQKIIYMQNVAYQLPDAFTNLPRVTKSHITAVNAPIRIDVSAGQYDNEKESRPHLKRGRPIGSKDKNLRKRKEANDQVDHNIETIAQEEHKDIIIDKISHEVLVPGNDENKEISINGDLEPKSIDECRRRNDWPKWKDAIQVELASLEKHEVFGPIVQTHEGVKPVGYKWVFVRKQNEKGEIIRHKARLVAQGFSQRPDIDYMETYSPVVDAITFRVFS
ncbi:uncharacterized protein LOC142176269 [Nicotiana tabacum]|uniref:Uncharacterized protein LOC142176269 n=1 Tax=Nicotiana tabacum TaxID=4097 RepID=A0AC58TQK0_TOBAC